MSWVTVLWSMNAAVCLTLAVFYAMVWCKQRDKWVHLLFASSAVAVAAISAFELWMMNASTAEQYQLSVRWVHVPTWLLTVSFVAFVQFYLHAGRRWLAWSIYSLRTLVLILNFIFPVSINFRAITDIYHLSWAGAIFSVPVGVPNPWSLISNFSLLLLLSARPVGSYMYRIFTGQRTFFHPVLRPVEVGIYRLTRVDEEEADIAGVDEVDEAGQDERQRARPGRKRNAASATQPIKG